MDVSTTGGLWYLEMSTDSVNGTKDQRPKTKD
jgi:hypothetical protein